jgi:hypothetical protein
VSAATNVLHCMLIGERCLKFPGPWLFDDPDLSRAYSALAAPALDGGILSFSGAGARAVGRSEPYAEEVVSF